MNIEHRHVNFPTGLASGLEPLANQHPFAVGPIAVEPALRKLVGPTGCEAVVEPLVMKVLITLARADTSPCSRDELVNACWGRRIVGDDAVNRVISNLRRQLMAVGGEAVTIETIAKVGYRLQVSEQPDHSDVTTGHQTPSTVAQSPAKPGWRLIGLAVLAAVAAVVAAVFLTRGEAGLAMAIEPATEVTAHKAFAGDLAADMSPLVGPMTGLTLIDAGDRSQADLLLKVSQSTDAKAAHRTAHVRLVDRQSGAVVWSSGFTGPTVEILRERTAYGIAGVIQCGLHRSSGDLGDAVSKRLYLAACDAVDHLDWPRAQSLARQIVERRPDSAASWACLSLTTANLASSDPSRRNALVSEAEQQAQKALAIDADSGLAYQAIAVADELAGRAPLPTLEEGVRRDPEHSGLLLRYSRALAELGYVQAAVDAANRANALEPSSYFTAQAKLIAMIGAGQLDAAKRFDEHVRRIWNDSFNTGFTRNVVKFYSDDPVGALAAFERERPANPMIAARQRIELRWRAAPDRFDWRDFDRIAVETYAYAPKEAWFLAFSAARMGDLERAFAWLERAPPATREVAPMFWPDAALMRRDPRFFRKMQEIGIVDKWRERGSWPDFCSDPELPNACRSMAQRLRANSTQRKSNRSTASAS